MDINKGICGFVWGGVFMKIISSKIDKETKRVLINLLNLSFVKFFTYLIPLITIPYIIRRIGLAKFGVISLAQALSVYFNLLFNFGVGLIGPKEVSLGVDDKIKLNDILTQIYSAKFILFFVSLIFFFLSIFVFPFVRENILLFWLFFISTFLFSVFPSWFFIGIQRSDYITIINTPFSILSAIFIFILIKKPEDFMLIPVISIFGGGIISLIGLYIVVFKYKIRFSIVSFKKGFKLIKRLFPFFLSRLSINFYTSTGTIILGVFLNSEVVGKFAIADKVVKLLKDIFSPLYDATLPFFTKLFHEDVKRGKRKLNQFLGFGSLINFFIISFVIIFRKFIIIFFSGGVNFVSEISLILLSIIIFFVYPSVIIGRNALIPLGMEKEFNVSIIKGAFTYFIIISSLFIAKQILGLSEIVVLVWVLIASIVSEIVIFSSRYYNYHKVVANVGKKT